MSEAAPGEGAATESATDFDMLIASLRSAGAERFDPVRLHYIDVLARRSAGHQGSVKRLLDARLAQALAEFGERFERAQAEAREALGLSAARYPGAAADLERLFAAGDFRGLRRLIGDLKGGEQGASLSALVRLLEQHPPSTAASPSGAGAGSRSELKTLRNFRKTWSKLSTDRQVAQALQQAPTNAGPINSHMLVLRSLALMRDISPDYLNRFMSYADTLLCLDQGEKEKPAGQKKPQAPRSRSLKAAVPLRRPHEGGDPC